MLREIGKVLMVPHLQQYYKQKQYNTKHIEV